ncbi:MAG: ABC transporter substrate-binding protein [Betaproteobacteria bacterium]|nr:ABC transporter substrate-binding protein [Betaproteobacteria bacterium]
MHSAPRLFSLSSFKLRAAALAFLVFAASVADAQPAHRLYKIGVLNEAWAANHPAVDGLKEGLREQGFVEGRDVTYEVRFTKGAPGATAAAAEELVKAGVDLIFTSNEPATLAAKKATQSIPVVFTLVGDPVLTGMVASLARPGGNLTGISSRATELAPKRLEVLKTLVTGLKRVWFVYHSSDITDTAALPSVRDAASRLQLELMVRPVNDAADLELALKEIKPGDAVLAPAVDTLDIPAAILEAAKVPSVFPAALWVGHGALVSYGPDFRAQGVQAARLIAKILRGARPQDLPVEGAERIDLAVNVNTARQQGLTVPPKILFRANVVQR